MVCVLKCSLYLSWLLWDMNHRRHSSLQMCDRPVCSINIERLAWIDAAAVTAAKTATLPPRYLKGMILGLTARWALYFLYAEIYLTGSCMAVINIWKICDFCVLFDCMQFIWISMTLCLDECGHYCTSMIRVQLGASIMWCGKMHHWRLRPALGVPSL